jgi:hypothetical protein
MPKRLREPGGVLAPRLVVEVPLRRRVVLVAHVGLDRVGIERRDRGGAEAVAQVVEAQPAKARAQRSSACEGRSGLGVMYSR